MLKRSLTFAVAFLIWLAPFAQAQESAIYGLKHAQIIPGWRLSNGNHMMAVDIKLEPNWKTYWRLAGGGGFAPRFNWQGSDNISHAKPHWPNPKLYQENGILTVGFKDRLILPIELTPDIFGADMTAHLKMDFGICADLCVPIQVDLEAQLPKYLSHGKSQIESALRNGVATSPQQIDCRFEPFENGILIHTRLPALHPSEMMAVYVEYPSEDWINQGRSKREGQTILTTVQYYHSSGVFLDRSLLKATLITQNGATEFKGCTMAAK